MRARIVGAAAHLFAEVGYEATTMAAVAERGETSIGNVYKYFQNKEALLDAVLPEEFAKDLQQRTRERVRALGTARDVRELPSSSRYHVLAGDLLEHCIAHRERIAILFARSRGTPFEAFGRDFTKALVGWALDYARDAYPGFRASGPLRFTLDRVYASFLASLGAAFTTFEKDADIREAVFDLTAHHQGGLKRLFEAVHEGRESS